MGKVVFFGVFPFVVLAWATPTLAELPLPVNRPVDFARDVHPILAENCYKCHSGDRSKGGLQVSTRELLLKGGESGPVVVEGDSTAGSLIARVASDKEDMRMPPEGRRLTADEIGILRAWIDQGLSWKESSPGLSPDASPLHLREVAVPAVEAGSINPIDKFMKVYLEQHGLQEPALVDEETFARRASMDLVGLLPTVESLQDLRHAIAPDKRAEFARGLLDDDRAYAEHWMTFWNDHLRNDFKGTGYIDGGRKAITGWLYASLEQNKPYDQFVRELISPTDASEGFIKGIVWRGSTAAVQRPPIQAAASTAQVFLGVNLKCASCHDSFIDNWKLVDCYGLANSFSDEPLELVRCDIPTGKMAEFKFLWPELGTIDGTLPREQRMARIAELVTLPENGPFTRAIVNRLWSKTMGRGIIEPLDNIQNKPWYPELLDWLARDLIEHGYDLKHTLHTIVSSRAYQWPSYPYSPEEEASKEFVFKGPALRKLSAEQYTDAISLLTRVWQQEPSFNFPGANAKENTAAVRAWRIPADPLMRALGRPNREQVTTRRETISTTLQLLELNNGATLSKHLQEGAKRLLAEPGRKPEALARDVYLQALQREPNAEELTLAKELLGNPVSSEGLEDVLWSISMLPEFQLIY